MTEIANSTTFNDIKKKLDENNETQRFISSIHRRNKKFVSKIKSNALKNTSINSGVFYGKALEIE